jgi:hypothetical protein
MRGQVDPLAAEADAFHFEAQALFASGDSPQFDLAARAEDALPGE